MYLAMHDGGEVERWQARRCTRIAICLGRKFWTGTVRLEELEAIDWYDQRIKASGDAECVRLYIEESFTFWLLSPQAAVPLVFPEATGKAPVRRQPRRRSVAALSSEPSARDDNLI